MVSSVCCLTIISSPMRHPEEERLKYPIDAGGFVVSSSRRRLLPPLEQALHVTGQYCFAIACVDAPLQSPKPGKAAQFVIMVEY